jgi:hypothetical protein
MGTYGIKQSEYPLFFLCSFFPQKRRTYTFIIELHIDIAVYGRYKEGK